MTVPQISELDLATLTELAPDLVFTDNERRAVLLENGSRDVNAAPGSGKTSVLAAKLLLLGQKWTDHSRGVCVLSHTNVAREEIQRRLSGSVAGSSLLAYPHFIGTIHSLVNQFLALPFMRSNGYAVGTIDDGMFSRRAVALANTNGGLRVYMAKNPGVAPMIEGLVYKGPHLEVASEGGKLPAAGAKTLPFILKIKQILTEQGIYRYADMFAFAEHLLSNSPHLKARISRRFPIVFVDEMQDTSWEQERLLSLIFDESVVIQRFGDVNQRILGNAEGAENLTFPKVNALPISTSKRFCPAIAKSVAGVQLTGPAVIGERNPVHPPMLMTYPTEKVGDVIAAFGAKVLDRFNDAALATGDIKALCARKQGDAKTVAPGRTLLDYWPSSAGSDAAGSQSERFWSLAAGSRMPGMRNEMLHRAEEIRRAVLIVLHAARAEATKNIRHPRQLIRGLNEAGLSTQVIRRLFRDMALSSGGTATEVERAAIITSLFDALGSILPEGTTIAKFTALPVFEEAVPVAASVDAKVCLVEQGGRKVNIQIGSVASMKGETHLATLILESYGHPGKRFDVEEALPKIAGLSVRDPKLKESHLSQYRNLYVGMSRPTSFLCLSVNAERVSKECTEALQKIGWVIEKV